MWQNLREWKGEIVEDFNIPFSIMDKTARQKIIKETGGLNITIDQLDITDIYRTLHSTAAEYTQDILQDSLY